MREKFYRLSVSVLTEEQHQKTCDYWYTVSDYHSPHTAFTTKNGLLRWLEERNLTLTKELTEPGTYSHQEIIGAYARESHLNLQEWIALIPIIETRTLSNGEYVEAKITEENGIRIIHTLNPNVTNRKTFDYEESSCMYR